MSKLDEAMARMSAALDRLETAVEAELKANEIWGEETPDIPALRAQRDDLADEVEALRARAAEDAKLRAEAARAVRDALQDLRGAVGEGSPANA